MIDLIARFIVRRRLVILILFFLATGFFTYHTLQVPIRTFFPDLVPDHPYSELAKKHEIFGGANQVVISLAVEKGDIFNQDTLAKVIDISTALQFIPGVDRNKVYSIGVRKIKNFKVTAWGLEFPSLMFPKPPQNDEEMELLKRNIFRNSLYYGRMVSLDTKAAMITAEFFIRDLDYNVIYKELTDIIEKNSDENTKIYVEGDPYLYGVIKNYVTQTSLIFGLTVLGMIVAAFWFARLARLVFVPVLSMLICAIWGLGCMNLLGFNMDPMVLVIPLLISARSLSHSMQFGWRINEEYVEQKVMKTACESTIRNMMYPGLSGVITDGIGILLIAFIPVPIMLKIGLAFFLWALSVIFVVLIFNPIVYLYLPTFAKAEQWHDKQKKRLLERSLKNQIYEWGKGKRAWAIAGAAIVLAMIATPVNLKLLRVGDVQPGTPLLKQTSTYNKNVTKIARAFPGLMDPIKFVVETGGPGQIANPNLMNDMAELQFKLMKMPEVMNTLSIVDLVQNINMKLWENNPKYFRVPDSLTGISTDLLMLNSGGAEAGDFDPYYDYHMSAANVVAYLKDHTADTIRAVLKGTKEILAGMKQEGYKFILAMGRAGNIAAVNESVEKNTTLINVLVFSSTFLFCALFFRSFMAGFILILPLGLANLFTLAYMGVAQLGLNLQSLPVSSIAVGIGVDYGIYLLSRIREEHTKIGVLEDAIKEALSTSGHAVVVTGLIMIIGVGFWNFSDIKFQSDMGLLLSIVTLLHILGTMFLLPALVRLFNPSFILKRYKGTA